MRKLLTFFVTLSAIVNGFSQSPGPYNTSGYFFSTNGSRSLTSQKTLYNPSGNTYQAYFADLNADTFAFQFDVDTVTHKLINWVALGNTPAAPASGFMTLDNPGNYTYVDKDSALPGMTPYLDSIYNR